MSQATQRQKQFVRALGHKATANLTKDEASKLIDQLLEAERQSEKKFPCPYCKALFGPRPKRKKKCAGCSQMIYHICGKFLTVTQLGELNQKEWFKEERKNVKLNVNDDWKDEQGFRREFKEKLTVGYLLRIGVNCPHAVHLNGLLVVLEDAKAYMDLLPPYDGCRHDNCECDYEAVSAHEVPRGTRVAEMVGQSKPASKRGCVSIVFLLIVAVCAKFFI